MKKLPKITPKRKAAALDKSEEKIQISNIIYMFIIYA